MAINNKIQEVIDFIQNKVNSELMTSTQSFLELVLLNSDGTASDDEQYNQVNGRVYVVNMTTGQTVASLNWARKGGDNDSGLILITPYTNNKQTLSLSLFYLYLIDIADTSDDIIQVQMGDESYHNSKPKKILKKFRFNYSGEFIFSFMATLTIAAIYWLPVYYLGFQSGGLLVFLVLLILVIFIVPHLLKIV